MSDLHSVLTTVTPGIAAHLLTTCAYDRQRTINKRHVTRLANEMRRGRFTPGTQVHIAERGSKGFIVNGNHTLSAIVESGVTVPLTILYTPCKNVNEVAALYSHHDIHKARQWRDTYKAYGILDEIQGGSWFTTSIGAAIGIIVSGLDRTLSRESGTENVYSRELRIAAIKEYLPAIESFYKIIGFGDKGRRILMRAGVTAVALETLHTFPTKAKEFWTKTAEDDGLHKGDPCRALLHYLRENRVYAHEGFHHAVMASALAWNAWYEDREITTLRVTAFKDFYLAGTAWKNGKRPEMECLKAKAAQPLPSLIKAAELPAHLAKGKTVGNGTSATL